MEQTTEKTKTAGTGFIGEMKNALLEFIRTPKRWIPTVILCGLWLVLSLLSGFGVNLPFFRFLYTLTYSNGGLYGGLIGAIGGIFGKAVFAALVTSIVVTICDKKNPFAGMDKGFSVVLTGASFSGLSAVAPFVIGAGSGLLVYFFFNITSSPVNCGVAVAGSVTALLAAGKQNGLLFSLIHTVIGKLSGKKLPSRAVISRALTGVAAGFAIGFALTFARYAWLLGLIGLLILAGGIVLAVIGNNGTKRTAATLALVLLVGLMVLPLTSVPVFADDDIGSYFFPDEYIPYRGHLTYSNGQHNKYGQPFPDVMDFNRNGYYDYYDLVIRQELSHNPDLLEMPESAVGIIAVSVTTAVIGSAAAAAAGAAVSAAAETGGALGSLLGAAEDLSPYVTRDGDGDLNVTDPATGEKILYQSNGDGTYTNPITGGTFSSAEELAAEIQHRAENADAIRAEAAENEAWNEAAREANSQVSFYDAEAKAEKAAAEAAAEHEAYIDKMYYKHGGEEGDVSSIKKEIIKETAEIEQQKAGYEARAEYADAGYNTAKEVETGADVAIDVLAEIDQTGVGKVVKDAYAVGKAAAGNAGEVMAGEKTVGAAFTQTIVESGVELGKNHAGGVAEKYAANVAGDGIKETTDTLLKGGTLEEARAKGEEAAIGGLVNATVDVAVDNLGDGLQEMTGFKGDGVLASAFGEDLTKDTAAEALKATAGDVIKNELGDD